MATAAASEHEISATRRKLSARIRWARTPLMVAVVGALLTFLAGVVTQELTTSSQDRAKRLELKTTLAADMSKSFTTAVGVARSVGTGTVYSRTGSPVTPDDYAATYNRGLGEWQIGSAALGAELSARFGDQPIVND